MNTLVNSSESVSIKKRKLDDSQTVPGLRMSNRLSALPDEILCHILSFVKLRDSVRTRLLSTRWRYLSDYRSVLHFDALNVLGREIAFRESSHSKFVSAVDQFLAIWKSWELSALKVHFCLGNKQASHIDRWVGIGIKMKIEDLELYFSPSKNPNDSYELSDQLFHSGKAFYLKCLRLKNCVLTFSSGWSSWISHLDTLELSFVRLHEKDIRRVLSGGLNLTSLSLVHCCQRRFKSDLSINVELPRLKKLFLDDSIVEIELNCPNLETLECCGRVKYFKFSHVPLLTKVTMNLNFHPQGCSLIFDGLARHAPKLQALWLSVMTEVQPLPANNTMLCLQQLHLQTEVPAGFDLFTLTYLLNASPVLEKLHLQLQLRHYTKQSPHREYSDFPHLKLKEVQIEDFYNWCNEMELAQYLLKNAVALQRMVIVNNCDCSSTTGEVAIKYCGCSPWREEIATTLLKDTKTTAELVILGVIFNKSN